MRRGFCTLFLGALLMAVCASCSSKRGPQVGGETHWLAACTQDEECGGTDLSCVCGTCTRACSGDAACAGGRDAACFDVNSPLLLQRCEDRGSGSSHGLCLPRCTKDADCGSGRACVQHTCVLAQQPDAGAANATASGQPGVSISDFNGVSDNVSWTDAVTVPTPQVVIAGADDSIVGTWQEPDCDPSQTNAFGPSACMRLVIERDAAGEVTGSVHFDRTDDIHGPFQPPQDPNVGYPIELDVTKYEYLVGNSVPGVPYRILDGGFENGRLTFTFANLDIWHEWCRLQTPYPWQLGGRGFYFCVPQDDAAQTSIDEAKIVLCTSADFGPLCSDGGSGLEPCSCAAGVNPRCSGAYCHCDSQACDADLESRHQVHLTLEGGRLSGTLSADSLSSDPVALERVSP
jgi:hypothetical protein